jgi:hypothetical protein
VLSRQFQELLRRLHASELFKVRLAGLKRRLRIVGLGPLYGRWPSLQPATIKHKATGDSPLLETGALRASIGYTVDDDDHVVVIGTNDPHAAFMEFGTSRIPPRSFLVGAMMAKQAEIHKICGEDMFAHAVTGKEPEGEPSSPGEVVGAAVGAVLKDTFK